MKKIKYLLTFIIGLLLTFYSFGQTKNKLTVKDTLKLQSDTLVILIPSEKDYLLSLFFKLNIGTQDYNQLNSFFNSRTKVFANNPK